MSGKSSKRIRRLEGRMDGAEATLESHDKWMEAMQAAIMELSAKETDRTFRRRAKEAERATQMWKHVAIAAIVSAIVVELFAIMAIEAKADEQTYIDPPVGVTAGEAAVEADVGPEEAENELIEAALLARAHVIEGVTATHYDCCVQCCGKDDGITASGVKATPGVTVAVDPTVIPLGSDVLVDYGDGELHYYRADDVGGAVKGNHIDLCVATHDEAIQLGIQAATVYWCEE